MAITWDPKDAYMTFMVNDAKRNGLSIGDYDS